MRTKCLHSWCAEKTRIKKHKRKKEEREKRFDFRGFVCNDKAWHSDPMTFTFSCFGFSLHFFSCPHEGRKEGRKEGEIIILCEEEYDLRKKERRLSVYFFLMLA